jgi:methylase of polypeptide subunit release factors
MSLKEYKNILSKINYKNSFKPTETSRVMYSSIIEELLNSDNLKKKKILDLGCGCGILTILLNQKFPNNTFYASDLDEGALLDSKENFDNFNLNINIHKSNIFNEWLKRKEKFDLIINDISGVSSYLIEETDWFNNSIPSEDKDGFELLKRFLNDSKNHLNSNGVIFFPILSVSNHKKALDYANKIFNIKLIGKSFWPAPINLQNKFDYLSKLRKDNIIDFEEKFGSIFFWTSVYMANQK